MKMNQKERLHDKHEFPNMRALVEWAGETHDQKNAYSYRTAPGAEITTVSFRQLRDDVRAPWA